MVKDESKPGTVVLCTKSFHSLTMTAYKDLCALRKNKNLCFIACDISSKYKVWFDIISLKNTIWF